MAAAVAPLLDPHPLALVDAYRERAAGRDLASEVRAHQVYAEWLLGLADVGAGLDSGVPRGGVDGDGGDAGDGLRVGVPHSRADRELVGALAVIQRRWHIESRHARGVGAGLTAAAPRFPGLAGPVVVVVAERVVLVALDADRGRPREHVPLDMRVEDGSAEVELRACLRQDLVTSDVVSCLRLDLDIELGDAELRDRE